MDIHGHPPTTNSSLFGWFSRHYPLPPSSLPSFLQPPNLPSSSSSSDHHPAPHPSTSPDKDQGVGSTDEDGGDEEIHVTEPVSEEEVTVGGGLKRTTARMFNVLRNFPAVGWLSLPSSSLPPCPQHPQDPIPSSMATPSPSLSLHISDADLPDNTQNAEPPAHTRKVKLTPRTPDLCKLTNSVSSDQHQLLDVGSSSCEMEETMGECRDVIQEEMVEHQNTDAAVEEEQGQLSGFEMEAEPAAHMGMMRKVKLPGRRRLCKLSNSVSSDQDHLQDVGSNNWEMENPTGDCRDDVQEVVVDHDTDAAAAAEEEQDQLPDFEMEAPVGSSEPPYKLQSWIFNKLYTHQREELSWLWSLHCRGTGGILGDDMGLGKTMQVSAFLAGLFHSGLIRRVLVVAPPTILTNWDKELSVVGLGHKISIYSGPKKDVRNYKLQHAFKEGGILLTTYDLIRKYYKQIRGDFYDGEEEGEMWNYVILDEAQFIKNSAAQRSQRLLEIPCAHRIAISGTLIQNNFRVSPS